MDEKLEQRRMLPALPIMAGRIAYPTNYYGGIGGGVV
jgi:hypothetical protein